MEEMTYTLDDLVSFGKYLLSDERINLITSNHVDEDVAMFLSEVHDADIANWLGSR